MIYRQAAKKICFLSEKQNTVGIFSGGKGGQEKIKPFKRNCEKINGSKKMVVL